MTTLSTYQFTDLDGQPQSLAEYAGKVVLVVNVASNAVLRRSTPACRRCGSATATAGWW